MAMEIPFPQVKKVAKVLQKKLGIKYAVGR